MKKKMGDAPLVAGAYITVEGRIEDIIEFAKDATIPIKKESKKCGCGWHSANCSERKNKGRQLAINHGGWTSEEAREKFIMKERSLKKRLAQKDGRKLKELKKKENK